MYHDHWKGLANLEFEASLGELEDDGGGQISFVRGAIVRPIQHKDTLSCSWPEKNNVGIRSFKVGKIIWFSRSHPQRDGVGESCVVVASGYREMEVRFRSRKTPIDLQEGEWRIDGDYVTFGLQWILSGLASFVYREKEALQQLIVADLTEDEAKKQIALWSEVKNKPSKRSASSRRGRTGRPDTPRS